MGSEVDFAFVQATEHRPNPTAIDASGIPLIDLSPLNSISSDDLQSLPGLIAEVGSACRDWGFFQVIKHGVPLELLDRLQSAASKFFALSIEEKRKIRRNEVNPMGYYETEHTKNVRDWKEVFDFIVQDPTVIPASDEIDDFQALQMTNQWPVYPPEFREAAIEYTHGVEKLAFKLLELISLSLDLPAKRMNGYFKDQLSLIRINHYPPCPEPHLALGVGRHKDSMALTVLAQDDVGGLQVKRKTDGEWVGVKPIPNAYIINVGDIIQVWSNDRYESVEHRVVVNSEKERYSIPFFLAPAHYVMVKPLEELTDEKNPPKYREYSWGKFFKARRLSNLKKLDVENLQIHHFKITE